MKCPHCGLGTTLKDADPQEYKRRKIANAIASSKKAKANGSHIGRNKMRDDLEIRKLRAKGLSIRAIAKEIGMSTATVQRGLK